MTKLRVQWPHERRYMEQRVPEPTDEELFRLFDASYTHFVGSPLTPPIANAAEWLYNDAPFAVLAEDSSVPDTRIFYANRTAQRWFGYSHTEFIGMRACLLAQELALTDRSGFLERVTRKGFVSGHRSLRISRTGRRFWVIDEFIWQLRDTQGVRHGQATKFTQWHDI